MSAVGSNAGEGGANGDIYFVRHIIPTKLHTVAQFVVFPFFHERAVTEVVRILPGHRFKKKRALLQPVSAKVSGFGAQNVG
jgi:hypothetical protein